MKINKIPLQQRLDRLDGNYPAHDEYIPALLRSFADQTMDTYFSGFDAADSALRTLSRTVHIPEDELRTLTYETVASIIACMSDKQTMHHAVNLLSAPPAAFFEDCLRRKAKEAKQ